MSSSLRGKVYFKVFLPLHIFKIFEIWVLHFEFFLITPIELAVCEIIKLHQLSPKLYKILRRGKVVFV